MFREVPVTTAAELPEAVGVFASAPLKTGVSTYEPFVCPDKVMETVSESPVKPVSVIKASHDLSILPETVTKTASEFI